MQKNEKVLYFEIITTTFEVRKHSVFCSNKELI